MREDPTCLRATKLMHHKYWICAPKPGSRSYWSPIKAMLCNKRSHGSERPVHQLQKSPHSSEDPAKPKKKKRCREQLLKDCFFFFLIYLFGCAGSLSCSMWDPVSWPGNEPGPSALGLQRPSHWTTREVPEGLFIQKLVLSQKWPYFDLLRISALRFSVLRRGNVKTVFAKN